MHEYLHFRTRGHIRTHGGTQEIRPGHCGALGHLMPMTWGTRALQNRPGKWDRNIRGEGTGKLGWGTGKTMFRDFPAPLGRKRCPSGVPGRFRECPSAPPLGFPGVRGRFPASGEGDFGVPFFCSDSQECPPSFSRFPALIAFCP